MRRLKPLLLRLVHPTATTPHRTPPELSAEQCAQLAEQACDRADFATALEWVRLAQRLAPTSVRLRLDEGCYLESAGDEGAALACYARAAASDPSGEAHFLHGALLRRLGRHVEAAESLARAVDAAPAFAVDVESDPLLGRLAHLQPLARALARAHAASW